MIDFCAACFPELLNHLCRHWADPSQAKAVQRLSRQAVADLNREQEALVNDLVRQFRSLSGELGVAPLI